MIVMWARSTPDDSSRLFSTSPSIPSPGLNLQLAMSLVAASEISQFELHRDDRFVLKLNKCGLTV